MRANVTTFSKITAVAVGALVRSAKAVSDSAASATEDK